MRPTKDRVKEALFNILQFEIRDKSFLDLFGGTGQIGIEAFSRNAKNVTIVDNSSESIKIIRSNVAKIKSQHENINIIRADARNFLRQTDQMFDIVFLDPPYVESSLLAECMDLLERKVTKDSIVITETLFEQNQQNISTYFSLKKVYKYGKMCLKLYKNAENISING